MNEEKRRMRGMGRVFKRQGSTNWWIAYYHRGQEHRESSGSSDEGKAWKLLRQRLKEIGADQLGLRSFVGHKQERVIVGELLDLLESDFKLREVRGLQRALSHSKAVREFFGDARAVDVDEKRIEEYIEQRLAENKAHGTVNRETQLLGQAFRLGVERKLLSTAPTIRKLPEHNVRQGFFERPEFEALVANLPEHLRDFTRFAYLCGWRRGEIASLGWGDVDRDGKVIRLPSEHSKNGRGRVLVLDGELLAIIERRWAAREYETASGPALASLVFHRAGAPIRDCRKSWSAACKAAGVPGRLFHDLRRTAVRNMVRADVREGVAMAISGHKTRSMFDRYNIVSEGDLRDAVKKIDSHVESLPTKRTVVVVPIVVPSRRGSR